MIARATDTSRHRLSPRMIVSSIVNQHAEDAAALYGTRSVLAVAAHVRLHQLGRFDERLQLHLDGLRIAGTPGFAICNAALEMPTPGTMFVASALALSEGQVQWLDRLFLLAEAVPASRRGLLAAFGWVDPAPLRGVIVDRSSSVGEPLRRLAAVCAQALHRTNWSGTLSRATEDPAPTVCARAWRAAGELGEQSFLSLAASAMSDADPACHFWAAWAAVLLGDRRRGLEALGKLALETGPYRARALHLALQAMKVDAAHALLKSLTQQPAARRWIVKGAGLVGDSSYVPWLISLMSEERWSRPAGEAFSLMTGLDLAWLDLERAPPEGFQSGPIDDPDDPSIEMDEDEGLPWPDPERVEQWWRANSQRFQPGVRYFMGAQPSWEHCLQVLKDGYQRQRMAAAEYLCLLRPGTKLFNCKAPAWRQQRWLARL